MALGDLTLSYYGRSYTFTFSGSAITPTSQVFAVDDYVTFTTTGTLPTGLTLNTVYRVVSAGSNIEVSATEGGSPISLSGGSGTHSIRVVLSVVFRLFSFTGNAIPRESLGLSGNGSFVPSGNFNYGGIGFEDPQKYFIEARISYTDVDALLMAWKTVDNARRDNRSPFMTLSDHQFEFAEEGKTAATKTRSHIAGTTPRQQNGGVYYYPVFQVYMPREPVFGIDTNVGNRTAVIELQETGVKI